MAVEHSIELLLQALLDFFAEIVLAVQMIEHQINEQVIGYLYTFDSFLSVTVVTIVTVFLIPRLLSF